MQARGLALGWRAGETAAIDVRPYFKPTDREHGSEFR